ncbi:beta-ketoacyl synthase N-terminal-like domain-containing protein, partial [Acinetobacter baumannii]
GPVQGGDRAIAVVGFALRFPDADDADGFWANLLAGRDSVRRPGREALLAMGLPATLVDDPDYVGAQAVLDGVDLFDPAAFAYAPGEVAEI